MTTFGIEIEFLMPQGWDTYRVANELAQRAELPVRAATRSAAAGMGWKVVSDASVQQFGRVGMEVVSPILEERDFDKIRQICRALSEIGARVNRTCGLHVHVGARSLSLDSMKRLAILYGQCEPFLDQLLPPSRRGDLNTYCKSLKQHMNVQRVLTAHSVTHIAQGIQSASRYVKLNFTSYWRHGTVEFRQHSGTIDPEKIINWALLCSRMVTAAVREVNMISTPMPTAPTQPATGAVDPDRPSGYWRSGRRTRTIWRLTARPEGATAEEIREALGVRTRPDIGYHAARAQDGLVRPLRPTQRRGGCPVWVARPAGADVTITPPPSPQVLTAEPRSLEEFLDRVQVPPSEYTYWIERAALLTESRV